MSDLEAANDAKEFMKSAILNWGTDQAESNACVAAASANALISIAESLSKIAESREHKFEAVAPPFFGMKVCEHCGDKRCPHAVDLSFECDRIKTSEDQVSDHA